jgi:hypothetical protein
MKNLVENFKHFLTEAKNVYEAEMRIKAQPDMTFYKTVFEAIRGIEGVTIIRPTEAIRKDPHNNQYMNLYVRLYIEPANVRLYIKKLKDKIIGLKDADGNRITYAEIRKYPEKSDDLSI